MDEASDPQSVISEQAAPTSPGTLLEMQIHLPALSYEIRAMSGRGLHSVLTSHPGESDAGSVCEHWPNGRGKSETMTIYRDECCGPGKSKGLGEHRTEQLNQLKSFIGVLGHELNHKG